MINHGMQGRAECYILGLKQCTRHLPPPGGAQLHSKDAARDVLHRQLEWRHVAAQLWLCSMLQCQAPRLHFACQQAMQNKRWPRRFGDKCLTRARMSSPGT